MSKNARYGSPTDAFRPVVFFPYDQGFPEPNQMVYERCATQVLPAADGDDDGAIHGDDVNRAFWAAFVGVVAR